MVSGWRVRGLTNGIAGSAEHALRAEREMRLLNRIVL